MIDWVQKKNGDDLIQMAERQMAKISDIKQDWTDSRDEIIDALQR